MSVHLYRKRRRFGIGGFLKNNAQAIGTGLGAGVGALAGNPALGAKIGSAAGGLAQGALQDEQQPQQQVQISPEMFNFGGTRGAVSFRKGGALQVKGRSHNQGGVQLGNNTEVEGGETIGGVQGQPHVFSEKLKVPGTDRTFAELHRDLVQRGASDTRINNLAQLQSKVAGRGSIGGTNLQEGGLLDPPYGLSDFPSTTREVLDFFITGNSGSPFGRRPNPRPFSITLGNEERVPGVESQGMPNLDKPVTPTPGIVSPTNRVLQGRGVDVSQNLNLSESGSSQTSTPNSTTKSTEDPTPPGSFGPSNPFDLVNEVSLSQAGSQSATPAGTSDNPTQGINLPEGGLQLPNSTTTIGDTPVSEIDTSDSGGSRLSSAAEVADKALPFLPGAINVARGIFGKAEGADLPRLRIPRTAVNEARRIDTDLNVRPQLASATRAFRSATASPNTSEAGRQAAFAKLLSGRAGIQAQEENQETGLRNKRQQLVSQLLGNIESREAQVNQKAASREEISQQKAEAAKSNLLGTGISQLVGTRQKQKATQRVQKARKEAKQAIENRSIQGAITALAGLPKTAQRNVIEALLPTITDPKMKQSFKDLLNNSQ